jgi:DNA-binding Lrp family transcriptional regulator
MKAEEWHNFLGAHFAELSAENRRIVELLAEGKTQPQIGEELGLHRSAVWRRVKKLVSAASKGGKT